MAVDHVQSKEQRNMQPRLLHRDVLIVVRLLRARYVEQRADLALRQHRIEIELLPRRSGDRAAGRILRQLPDLFLERHLRQQFVHPRI